MHFSALFFQEVLSFVNNVRRGDMKSPWNLSTLSGARYVSHRPSLACLSGGAVSPRIRPGVSKAH